MNTAFVFPGQGSQFVGMLSELADKYGVIKDTFSCASQVLAYDLWDLVSNGPDEKLNQTEYTQPALLAASVAVYRLLEEKFSLAPTLMAGHSLGEYSALVCAQSLSFEKAIQIVQKRGQLMQQAVPEGIGGMAVIVGLTLEQVEQICKDASNSMEMVEPANINSIGQIVVSGHFEAAKKAIELAKGLQAKLARFIPVSVPAHCQLMREAAKQFEHYLQAFTLESPKVRVIHNVDVMSHDSSHAIKQALIAQLFSPVRWVETIEYFVAQEVKQVIELGPGKVLTNLNKRINNQLTLKSVFDCASLTSMADCC